MGTDIHCIWQKRIDNQWDDIPSNYEENRHYQLFAVLAGVRNGTGFAGVKLGESVTPISEPRGLPKDFPCNEYAEHLCDINKMSPCDLEFHKNYRDEGDLPSKSLGDHSFSWLSGKEMLDWYDNAPVVVQTGVIDRKSFERWDKVSKPDMYCGSIVGPRIKVIDAAMKDSPSAKGWTHIQVRWERSLKEELKYFFDEVKRLVDLHGEIRLVFGFDS